MKVKELIEELAKCNPDADVVPIVNGLDMSLNDVKNGNPANSCADVELIVRG